MRWVGLLAAMVTGASVPGPLTASIERSEIQVEVVGLRNDAGQTSCVLYGDPDAFPMHPEHAAGGTRVEIHQGVAHCVFHDVRPGTYAIAVHHDENNNHRMDRNLFGLPKEGYGFSRDARPRFAPPRFDDAKFEFTGGVLRLTVHITY